MLFHTSCYPTVQYDEHLSEKSPSEYLDFLLISPAFFEIDNAENSIIKMHISYFVSK